MGRYGEMAHLALELPARDKCAVGGLVGLGLARGDEADHDAPG